MLISERWEQKLDWKVKGLSRKSSDHIALIMFYKRIDWGPKPVRIFDHWFTNPNCKSLILDKLNEVKGSSITIKDKLKVVRQVIQNWNTQHNGLYDSAIHLLEKEPSLADSRGDIEESNRIQDKLRAKYDEQEAILRQKSRAIWLQKGDINTRYYHFVLKRRRWHNNIQGIMHKRKLDN